MQTNQLAGQQHQPQTHQASMASFVARLMSLNQQELQCLHSDSELMRQLTETQLLMESRLQHIQLQNKLQLHLQHHYQQQPYLHHYYHQLAAGNQQPEHLFPSPQEQLHQLALDLRTQQQQLDFRWTTTNTANQNQTINNSSSSSPTCQLNPKKLKLSEYQRSQQAEVASEQGHKRLLLAEQPLNKPSQQQQPKKYKGEFDEPTGEEVEQRQAVLSSSRESYHRLQRCACVLGSEFHDKSVESVLQMIDKWRQLPTEERIKTKWDLADLPKDIPLSEIKKFEELRREASNGRADFGGASKRKPLGIRATRQFLLILYCLWGHPGREDPMQKEGYCPHCFAKIKKPNEQSTLVRVVNHFNMKHRRGANPRLSPHRDAVAASASGASSNYQGRHLASSAPSPVSSTTLELSNHLSAGGESRLEPEAELEIGQQENSNSSSSSSSASLCSSAGPEVARQADTCHHKHAPTTPIKLEQKTEAIT